MDIKFSFEELEIQKAVNKFVRNDFLPIYRELDEKGELPEKTKKKFLSMGLLRSAFPEAYGGVGGSFTGLIIALKELSYASLVPSWVLFENFMLAYPLGGRQPYYEKVLVFTARTFSFINWRGRHVFYE
jgi:alkylation response protein AidB-like acyl-CoA dehydrogenase